MSHKPTTEARARNGCDASDGDGPAVQPRPGVLIVDDDPAILDGLGEFLTAEGFSVTTATEGREALQILSAGMKPIAILLDVMMPPMDGWDFRQRQLIDARLAQIPTIVISASGFSPGSIKAQFGDVEFIPKPIPLLTLLKTLRAAAEPRSPRAAASPMSTGS